MSKSGLCYEWDLGDNFDNYNRASCIRKPAKKKKERKRIGKSLCCFIPLRVLRASIDTKGRKKVNYSWTLQHSYNISCQVLQVKSWLPLTSMWRE